MASTATNESKWQRMEFPSDSQNDRARNDPDSGFRKAAYRRHRGCDIVR
jgi:hypothetical protein